MNKGNLKTALVELETRETELHSELEKIKNAKHALTLVFKKGKSTPSIRKIKVETKASPVTSQVGKDNTSQAQGTKARIVNAINVSAKGSLSAKAIHRLVKNGKGKSYTKNTIATYLFQMNKTGAISKTTSKKGKLVYSA